MQRRTLVRLVIFIVLVVAPLVGLSCKTNNISSKTNNSYVTVVLGPDGGVIDGPDGIVVRFPPGALESNTTIGVGVLDADAGADPAPPAGYDYAGPVFTLEPHGQSFLTPITITIPGAVDGNTFHANCPSTTQYPASTGCTWDSMPVGNISSGTFQASAFSLYALVDTEAAAVDCNAVAAAALAAPVDPPAKFLGLDLTAGDASSTGLTIDEANQQLGGCLQIPGSIETLGSRVAGLGPAGGGTHVQYNLDTRSIDWVEVPSGAPWTGSISFNSRAGGPFGTHKYVISLGHVTRDGVEFNQPSQTTPPAPIWGYVGSGCTQQASPWANEIVDGLIATFHTGALEPYEECLTAVPQACRFNPSVAEIGVRELGLYVEFTPGTDSTTGFYAIYGPAQPTCADPKATHEIQLEQQIAVAGTPSIGNLTLGLANGCTDAGLTAAGANSTLCNTGVDAAAPDPGYGATQWQDGAILLEYNQASNVGYKLFAGQGYLGTTGSAILSQDGSYLYTLGVGVLTKAAVTDAGDYDAGEPFAIDWASPNAAITELSNAVNSQNVYGGLTSNDTDCVAAGDCTIQTIDGGAGGTVVGFSQAQLFLVFSGNGQTPTQIYDVFPGGM